MLNNKSSNPTLGKWTSTEAKKPAHFILTGNVLAQADSKRCLFNYILGKLKSVEAQEVYVYVSVTKKEKKVKKKEESASEFICPRKFIQGSLVCGAQIKQRLNSDR